MSHSSLLIEIYKKLNITLCVRYTNCAIQIKKLLNHVAPKYRVFFLFNFSPNGLKLFYNQCLVPSSIMTANGLVLLNFFHDFSDFSSD